MSTLGVTILSRFSKPPSEESHASADNLLQARAALHPLIPDFDRQVQGKVVLDFGSGEGWHCLSFGEAGAKTVWGIEIDPAKVERGRQRALTQGLGDRVFFETCIPVDCLNACDLVFSRDSMEHYQDPGKILQLIKQCVRPGGQIIIAFGPTWYSPYGAHMNYFLPIPWVHLLFSEESIMTLRARFRKDGARRYEEVPGGLNRMSVKRFEKLIEESGLRVKEKNYHYLRDNQWLSHLPVGRELFINSIVCKLERP